MSENTRKIVLVGLEGFFKGEEFEMQPGRKYVIGRSSTADLSLKRTTNFSSLEEQGIVLDETFRYTSRRHFTINIVDNSGFAETSTQLKVPTRSSIKVTIECLSPNGIRIDGKRVSQMIIPELSSKPHLIEFGANEKLQLFVRN